MAEKSLETLALFDFDGTITTRDSLIEFIRFSVGNVNLILGMTLLSKMLISYKLKIIPNYKAKEKLLSYFFKGMKETKFKQLANEYSINYIDTIIRPKAMDRIKWHKKQGHKVVIVSASIECWLKPWCNENNLELISTKLEIKNSIITGKLLTKNCYGIEKVNRLLEKYNLNKYRYIYAYGDSNGDKQMLRLANEKYYKPFR
jgi:HAD superfamily hydrolase (TIGR01490 family)